MLTGLISSTGLGSNLGQGMKIGQANPGTYVYSINILGSQLSPSSINLAMFPVARSFVAEGFCGEAFLFYCSDGIYQDLPTVKYEVCWCRFGIGRFTTEEEVDYTAERIISHVKRLREMR